MDKQLVSIVLPIYNVEKYLDRCIKSVVEQTYKNIEIILVDDGSPDNCPNICNKWASIDSRVRVIHKTNAGLGMARNTGIENATGEYICFFDSDDYLNPNLIAECVDKMTYNNADFAVYGFCDVTEDEQFLCEYLPTASKTIFSGDEVQQYFVKHVLSPYRFNGECWNLKISAWNCMYRMSMIENNGFRFVSEREVISEDVYSLLSLYSKMSRVIIISEILYYHRVNSKSLTHIYRKDRVEKLNNLYHQLSELCEQLSYDSEIKCLVANPYINGMIGAMKMIANADDLTIKERKRILENTLNDTVFQGALKKVDLSSERVTRRILITVFKAKLTKMSYILLRSR